MASSNIAFSKNLVIAKLVLNTRRLGMSTITI